MASTTFSKPIDTELNDLSTMVDGLDTSLGTLDTTVNSIGKIVKHSDTSTLKKYSYKLPGGLLITVIRK